MAQTRLIFFSVIILALSSCGQTYRWEKAAMDSSRTGCTAATADNVKSALGQMNEDGSYLSPSGVLFPEESATAKVASIVLHAQPHMADVKKVIAQSEEYMPNELKENRLSNWFVDIIMNKVSSLSGKKIDVGICNFGGIRVGMPEGDVMLDDIKSMFPFKNYLVYLELTGKQLRDIFEKMALGKFQAIGGVRIDVADGKIVKAEIGGKPIDDDRLYSVATISFLLKGGDGLYLSEGAANLKNYDVAIVDAVLEYDGALTAQAKSIRGNDVVHVTIR